MGKTKRTLPHGKTYANGLKDEAKDAAISLGLTALIAWLFYRSIFGLFLFPAVHFVNRKRRAKKRLSDREKERRSQYKEMLLAVGNSLRTGYSVENAFYEAEKELALMYGRDAWILSALSEINRQVKISVPIEKAFLEFADETPMEEVKSFAEIFCFAKRLGGDYGKYLQRSAEKIGEKIDLLQEIDVMTAEKRMEMNVMSVMPIGIILYNTVAASDFLTPVYHNIGGVLLMSGCLVFYAAMLFLGDRIVDIRV